MRSTRPSRPSRATFGDLVRPLLDLPSGAPLPLLPHPLDALPAAINHLLAAEPWALAQLVPHANKTLFVVLRPFTVKLSIAPDGTVARAAPDVVADTTVTLPPGTIARAMRGGSAALQGGLSVEGDPELARSVSLLVRHLRWDVEDDLSTFVGDAAAHRIVAVAKGVHAQASVANRKVAESLSEYLLDEQPQLVRPRALEDFAARLRVLRDDVARLEKRIDRLVQVEGPRA